MISLQIYETDIAKQIINIINQLSLTHYYLEDKDSMPFSIIIKKHNNLLHINSRYVKEIKLQLPCSAVDLLEQLETISKNFYFEILDIIYYPLDQKLIRANQSIKLNLIHNSIFKFLSLNKEGIAKANLYKIIWPNDKDYQVNKLDTHITNLKNIILKELNKSISFESNNGILKINY